MLRYPIEGVALDSEMRNCADKERHHSFSVIEAINKKPSNKRKPACYQVDKCTDQLNIASFIGYSASASILIKRSYSKSSMWQDLCHHL